MSGSSYCESNHILYFSLDKKSEGKPYTMVIRVVEFSSRGTKLETFLTKNQQSQGHQFSNKVI